MKQPTMHNAGRGAGRDAERETGQDTEQARPSGAAAVAAPVAAPVITIDGPSGTGKGTIAGLLAEHLGWHLLDSGALYRTLALAARRHGVDLDAGAELGRLASTLRVQLEGERVRLDGEEVSALIRTAAAGVDASRVAVHAEVRQALLGWQRDAALAPGLVADGRDMGSRVFPDARLKLYLDASPDERARRRYKQLKDKGMDANLPALVQELRARDERDRERVESPLQVPPGGVIVDTTNVPIEQVFARVLEQVDAALAAQGS